MIALTRKQEKTIERLKRDLLKKNDYGHNGSSEIKRIELRSLKYGGAVSLVIEVGSKTDEGTMAAVFCRDYRHIFIGPRGGCTLVNGAYYRRMKDGSLKKYYRKGNVSGYFSAVHGITF